jgi:hypothetical protein
MMIPPATTTRGAVKTSSQGYRFLTSQAARALLGLPTCKTRNEASSTPLTLKELRHAYFAAAKKCHPDLKNSNDNGDNDHNSDDNSDNNNDDSETFLQVTLAYEMLQAEITKDQDLLISTITVSEDEEFRRACRTQLNIDAEIVEECKQNPMFRQWLMGRTDSAHLWRSFFTQHGGLAPKLRPLGGLLAAGRNAQTPAHTTRRKKK